MSALILDNGGCRDELTYVVGEMASAYSDLLRGTPRYYDAAHPDLDESLAQLEQRFGQLTILFDDHVGTLREKIAARVLSFDELSEVQAAYELAEVNHIELTLRAFESYLGESFCPRVLRDPVYRPHLHQLARSCQHLIECIVTLRRSIDDLIGYLHQFIPAADVEGKWTAPTENDLEGMFQASEAALEDVRQGKAIEFV